MGDPEQGDAAGLDLLMRESDAVMHYSTVYGHTT